MERFYIATQKQIGAFWSLHSSIFLTEKWIYFNLGRMEPAFNIHDIYEAWGWKYRHYNSLID